MTANGRTVTASRPLASHFEGDAGLAGPRASGVLDPDTRAGRRTQQMARGELRGDGHFPAQRRPIEGKGLT